MAIEGRTPHASGMDDGFARRSRRTIVNVTAAVLSGPSRLAIAYAPTLKRNIA